MILVICMKLLCSFKFHKIYPDVFLRFYEVNHNSLDNRIVSGIFRRCKEKQIHYMKNKVKAVGVILNRELKQRRRQRKRHLKMSLFHLCYFAIISTRSTFTIMANYPETKLVGVAYKLRKKMKNSPPCVHVLHKTLNVVISRCCFAENGKKCTKM